MKRNVITTRMIQVVACGFGLLGLFGVYDGVCSAATAFRDPSHFETFFTAAWCFILGGVLIAVAWNALWRFGPDVIRSVVALVLLVAWSLLAWFPEPSQDDGSHGRSELLEIALVLGPLYLALLLYRVLSRKLIQMTGTAIPSNGPTPANDKRERNPRETTVSDLHISHPRSDA